MIKPHAFAAGGWPALQTLLDELPIALCLRDAESMQIVGWNTGAEQLSGHSRNDMLGKLPGDLLDQSGLQWLHDPRDAEASGQAGEAGAAAAQPFEGLFHDAEQNIRTLRVFHRNIRTNAQAWRVTCAIDIGDSHAERHELIDFVQRVIFGDYDARLQRDHSGSHADTVAELFNMLSSELAAQLKALQEEIEEARQAPPKLPERISTAPHGPVPAYRNGDFDALACGVFVCNRRGRIVAANKALLQMLGLGLEDVVGSTWPIPFWEHCPTMPSKMVGRHQGTLLRADGSKLTAELVGATASNPERTIVTVRDTSKEDAIRQQLYISERQATIGTLASGVAHEINNPLMYISGNLEIAMEAVKKGESPGDLLEMLQDAYYGANLIKQIVHDLRLWTRAQADRLTHVNLKELLQACLAMARPVLKHRASTKLDVQEGLSVPGYEARLAQLFLNLVVNAAQAIGEGNVADNLVRIVARRQGSRVVVVVSDSGCGMGSAEIAHMFEPFFTTKGKNGTGLGLALAANIIEAHSGKISVNSTVNVGTEITVSLPARSLKPVKPVSIRGSMPIEGELNILLIDDDTVVADTLRRSLSHHQVTTFADARSALTVLSDQSQDFDVVLCDVMMPLMSGIEFYHRLEQRSPHHAERVIFVTGGGLDQGDMHRLEACKRPLLWKPIGVHALRKAVTTMVSRDQRVAET